MRGTRLKNSLTVVLLLAACFDASNGRPAEEPTKFALGTAEAEPAPRPLSTLDQGRELLGRIADAIRIGRGRFVNSVTLARNIAVDQAETLATAAQNNVASVVIAKTAALDQGRRSLEEIQVPVQDTRPTFRETARLESEAEQALLERPLSNTPGVGALENLLQPKPLIDGIREEEKYGNSGDRFIGIGRALVGGFEGLSNFLNTIVDLPRNAIKNTSRGITEVLNQVGARVIGLQ